MASVDKQPIKILSPENKLVNLLEIKKANSELYLSPSYMEIFEQKEDGKFQIILAGRKLLGILSLEFVKDENSKIVKIFQNYKSVQNPWKRLDDFSAGMPISENGWLIGKFDGKMMVFDSRQKNLEQFSHLHLDAIHQFQKLKNSSMEEKGLIHLMLYIPINIDTSFHEMQIL